MGRKNNNKKKQSKAKAASAAADAELNPKSVAWKSKTTAIDTADDEFYPYPPVFVPTPNMGISSKQQQQILLDEIADACPRTNPPTNTAVRLMKCYRAILEVNDSTMIPSIPFSTNIYELKNDDLFLKSCVIAITTSYQSDFRICPVNGDFLHAFPALAMHITELHPLEECCETQLVPGSIDAFLFVILLVSAMKLKLLNDNRFALQIIHELHAHAAQNSIDFEVLQHNESTKKLTGNYVRFVLATVAIKVTKSLYRNKESRTGVFGAEMESEEEMAATTSAVLVRNVELFANEQIKFQPESPIGYWNLGWVDTQVKYNGRHVWSAAADCYNNMTMCYKLADKCDDDFLKANGRIEAAMCIVIGASGMVGYTLPNGEPVQATRKIQTNAGPANNVVNCSLSGPTTNMGQVEALRKEKQRIEKGYPATRIDPGEQVIVPHWEVRRLWNQAMESYQSLERYGHGNFVCGEVSGWDAVPMFLKEAQQHLAATQFSTCCQIGFRAHRDRGFELCDYCHTPNSNRTELMKCSVCKKVGYCSKDCQRKHWKAKHKAECFPASS